MTTTKPKPTEQDRAIATAVTVAIAPLNAALLALSVRRLLSLSHRLLGTPPPPEMRKRDAVLLAWAARRVIACARPLPQDNLTRAAQAVADARHEAAQRRARAAHPAGRGR